MATTLRTSGDRAGQSARRAWLLAGWLAAFLAAAGSAAAAPGDYKARRFDVTARAVDGALDVSESITFEFQSGTFTKVWREIPASRTDGIQIVGAALDGAALTPGDGPGHFSVSGRNRVRVEWHFPETGPSVHRFDLHYVARGVVYREGGSDVVRWRALPNEHRYRIDASRVQFEPPGARVAPPETHRVGSVSVQQSGEAVTIDAAAIQSNGWVTADLQYPAGTLIAGEPAWRTHQTRARQIGPKWAMGGAAIFVAGLLLVFFLYQGYRSPAQFSAETTTSDPPAPLPAAIAAALAAKGRRINVPGTATLLDLADRGVLTVREIPGMLGTRSYELSQVPGSHDLEPHEADALTIAFGGRGDNVPLARARGRLGRQARRFGASVYRDMADRGLLDPERKAIRDRLSVAAFAMLLVAALGIVAAAALVPDYEAWPFLVPVGLLNAGIVGIAVASLATPLSDQGLIEAARWRGFKHHLKTIASRDDERGGAAVPSRWIVYALATGLGVQWARYLKRHPGFAPSWFLAASQDPGGAFAVFVGSHAGGSGGGASGAGAAGGGGSGAG